VKTGTQYSQLVIDSRFRGNDRKRAFFKGLDNTLKNGKGSDQKDQKNPS